MYFYKLIINTGNFFLEDIFTNYYYDIILIELNYYYAWVVPLHHQGVVPLHVFM